MMEINNERRKGTRMGLAAFIPATKTTKLAVVTRIRAVFELFSMNSITFFLLSFL
jgi:hypothetical protein